MFVLFQAANESFVHFDVLPCPADWPASVGRRHELPQFMANPPSALVGDASLPLDFLGRDAMSSAGHEVHRKEPDRELGAALVKDGPGCGIDVMAAPLAGVSPPRGHRMKLHPLVADLTMRLVPAVLDFHDPCETGRVIGIFGLELLESVFGHSGAYDRRARRRTRYAPNEDSKISACG